MLSSLWDTISKLDYGDVPAWVAALAAVFAAVGLLIQLQHLADDARARENEQARMLAISVDVWRDGIPLKYVNGGGLPIRDVKVLTVSNVIGGEGCTQTLHLYRTLPPTFGEPAFLSEYGSRSENRDVKVPTPAMRAAGKHMSILTVLFTDAKGQRWERTHGGDLRAKKPAAQARSGAWAEIDD